MASLSLPRLGRPLAQRMRVPDSLKASVEPFRRYWSIYGGWRGLARSIYIYAALALTLAAYPFWAKIGTEAAQLAIDVVPSIMAFSLGGMAIVLAFSDGKFLKAIRQSGAEKSLFMKVISIFFHFLAVQTLAICTAILVKAFPAPLWLSGVAFFMLAYSLTSALATAAMLFNVSRIYNAAGDDDDA